jgi:hypothetical protein
VKMLSIPENERTTLDQALGHLSGRLNGAIDFWTLVCLGQFPPDPQGFIRKYGAELAAAVESLGVQLARPNLDRDAHIHDWFTQISAGCQQFQEAYLILAQFREVPLSEVQRAAETVGRIYADLQEWIRQLGTYLGVPLSYRKDGPKKSEREAYYQQMLNRLFDLFRQELQSSPPGRSVPAGSV